MRLSNRAIVALAAVVGLLAMAATGQIVPAASAHDASVRVWLAARAAGIVAFGLLTVDVVMGMFLAHPDQPTFRQAKRVYPWHAILWVFTSAFLFVHIVAIILDPYAGVGLAGSFFPGLSSYRTVPVALGSLALYALLITALTARAARRLPAGLWLKLHRFALLVWILAWAHGLLAGTDSVTLLPVYVAAGGVVAAAAAHRYWVVRESAAARAIVDVRP
jgi:DMSO/TMAO reductase YedYZ heme-binding membrane subunit